MKRLIIGAPGALVDRVGDSADGRLGQRQAWASRPSTGPPRIASSSPSTTASAIPTARLRARVVWPSARTTARIAATAAPYSWIIVWRLIGRGDVRPWRPTRVRHNGCTTSQAGLRAEYEKTCSRGDPRGTHGDTCGPFS